MSRFSSLHLRFLALILVALLPIVGLLVYTNLQTQELARSDSTAGVERLTNIAAQAFVRSVNAADQVLTTVAQLPEVSDNDTAGCDRGLANLLRFYPQYAAISVVQPDGIVMCHAPPAAFGNDVADQDWFRATLAQADQPTSHYEIDPFLGLPVVVVSRALVDRSGQIKAIVAADISLDSLDKLLPPASLPSGSELLMVDHQGTVLTRYPQPDAWAGRALPNVGIIRTIVNSRQGAGALQGEDGVQRLYAWAPVDGNAPTAYLAIGIPQAAAFAVADDVTLKNLSLFGAAVILAFLAAWVASDYIIVRQADALLAAAGRLGSGDLSARIRLKYRLGGAPIVAAFNNMARSLEDHVQALRESEERYRRIVETATEGIWIVDAKSKTEYVNGRAAEMLGTTPEQMTGRSLLEYLSPQEVDSAGADLERKLKSGGGAASYRLRRKDGRRLWVEAAIKPFLGENNAYKGALIMFHDVTDRRRAEAEIHNLNATLERRVRERTAELYHRETALRLANIAVEQERNRLRTLIESLPDQVWFADAEGNLVLMNPAASFTASAGNENESATMLPDEWETLTADGHLRRPEDSAFYRCLHGEPVFAEEIVRHRQTGQWRYRQINAAPLRGRAGNIIGAVAIVRDMTEHKRAENMIAQLNRDLAGRAAELQAANQELEAFSYSVSHDLRAPLASIDGFSRLLLQDHQQELPPSVVRYVQLIQENAIAMTQLIEDLLHLSRASRQPINKQTVNPAELAREVLADLRSAQIGRQIELELQDLPPCQADPVLLKQVYANLLSNALKFTRRREIAHLEIGYQKVGEREVGRATAGQTGVEPAVDSVVYYVKDNGVGFDMKTADSLFRVFRRLHSEDEYEGTGVGLAIVERIIRRHGGRVWAEAEVEKGATFYFTL